MNILGVVFLCCLQEMDTSVAPITGTADQGTPEKGPTADTPGGSVSGFGPMEDPPRKAPRLTGRGTTSFLGAGLAAGALPPSSEPTAAEVEEAASAGPFASGLRALMVTSLNRKYSAAAFSRGSDSWHGRSRHCTAFRSASPANPPCLLGLLRLRTRACA